MEKMRLSNLNQCAAAVSSLQCQKAGETGMLVLNRPAARNAITYDMWEGIPRAVRQLENIKPRAIVLAGKGPDLGIGADLNDVIASTADLRTARAYCTTLVTALISIARCDIPTVAFFHGAAVGGTVELALACGTRVACPDARIYFPFARLGITPDSFTAARLAAIVGNETAATLIGRSDPISATEALSLNLIDAIVANKKIFLSSAHVLSPRKKYIIPKSAENVGVATLAEPMAQSLAGGTVYKAAVEALKQMRGQLVLDQRKHDPVV